jgi:phosphatidylglycerophosphatase C
VARTTVSLRTVAARDLVAQLERLRTSAPAAAVVFDADGTLWSGDIGIDAFERAIQSRLLREEARPALEQSAVSNGLASRPSASELAGDIFAAYRQGRFPEREAWEIMTWCYAGFTPGEVADHARATVQDRNLAGRIQREIEPIMDWARGSGVRTLVVSASPESVVRVAAELWGFTATDVVGATPAIADGRFLARLQGVFPYGAGKVTLGRELLGPLEWLASFGDGTSDLHMLETAKLGVAVRPKASLRMRLGELPKVVVLE